jgi:hypothetical protein
VSGELAITSSGGIWSYCSGDKFRERADVLRENIYKASRGGSLETNISE